MELSFIHLASFVADWKDLDLGDDELRELEGILLKRPKAGKVMPRCGGLRKVRFAPTSWGVGKSGAVRVIYAHFPDFERVYFFAAYGKNVQENLTADEESRYRKLLKAIEARLRQEKP